MSKGTLTIVGLGPAKPEHVTLEAAESLRGADPSNTRVYALAHARDLALAVAADLTIRSIDYLYELEGVPRLQAYGDLADVLMRRAFDDGFDVLYLVAGSPLVLNDAVWLIRRRCHTKGKPYRLIHGMSFIELVLDRTFWSGHQGLQILSAWNLARDGFTASTESPLLVVQLGEYSVTGDAVDPTGSTIMLEELRDALLAHYPAEHSVGVLYSSGHPEYASEARAVALSALADEPVPVYSNLWVPMLDGPPGEGDVIT